MNFRHILLFEYFLKFIFVKLLISVISIKFSLFLCCSFLYCVYQLIDWLNFLHFGVGSFVFLLCLSIDWLILIVIVFCIQAVWMGCFVNFQTHFSSLSEFRIVFETYAIVSQINIPSIDLLVLQFDFCIFMLLFWQDVDWFVGWLNDWKCFCHSQKAESQLAYELQAAKEKQKIRLEELNIDVVERRKQIEVEEKEILRREKELRTLVTLPADYEARRVALVAEGERAARIRLAEGDAQRIRAIGTAEASSTQAKGQAEAERMRMRAAAYQNYGTAAITQLVLEAMPLVNIVISWHFLLTVLFIDRLMYLFFRSIELSIVWMIFWLLKWTHLTYHFF